MRAAFLFCLVAIALLAPPARGAPEYGSKDEAVRLVHQAAALVDKVGFEAAREQLMKRNGPFVDRDLYVVVIDISSGNRLSHGQNPNLVGTNFALAVDINGRAYGREALELLKTQDSFWIDYAFTDPVTKKILPKEAYFEKQGDYAFICGVYKR